MSAWDDLQRFLHGEALEWIVLGEWLGGTDEEEDPLWVPLDKRHILLDPGDAEPYMQGWSFTSGIRRRGYAFQVWTSKHILRYAEVPGARLGVLHSIPREPMAFRCGKMIEWVEWV